MKDWIREAFSGLFTGLDELITSDEEREMIKLKAEQVKVKAREAVLAHEKEMSDMRTRIITAEARGASWLQRNWRPLTMLCLVGLVLLDISGVFKHRLSDEVWLMLQIGLGGYLGIEGIRTYRNGKSPHNY